MERQKQKDYLTKFLEKEIAYALKEEARHRKSGNKIQESYENGKMNAYMIILSMKKPLY